MDRDTALLIIVTGRDRPGVTSRLSTVLAEHGARIADMEQVVLRGRLVLGIVVHVTGDTGGLQDALFAVTGRAGMQCEIDVVEAKRMDRRDPVDRHHVTMLGMPLRPSAIASVTSAIADLGGNIDRIERLSRYPILSFELLVSGISDGASLKAAVGRAAAEEQVDVAVQRAGLHRRAKRLIVFDVDSTLVDGEVIELLAAHAGCADQVAEITSRAMAGELDFEQSLRQRVALLNELRQAGTAIEESPYKSPYRLRNRLIDVRLRNLFNSDEYTYSSPAAEANLEEHLAAYVKKIKDAIVKVKDHHMAGGGRLLRYHNAVELRDILLTKILHRGGDILSDFEKDCRRLNDVSL